MSASISIFDTASNLAAVVALIISAITFWISFGRSKKIEQMRLSTELWQNIRRAETEIRELKLEYHSLDEKYKSFDKTPGPVMSPELLEINRRQPIINQQVAQLVDELGEDCNYFAYLVQIREISDLHLLAYYLPQILDKAKFCRYHGGKISTDSPIEKLLEAEKRIKDDDVKKFVRFFRAQ